MRKYKICIQIIIIIIKEKDKNKKIIIKKRKKKRKSKSNKSPTGKWCVGKRSEERDFFFFFFFSLFFFFSDLRKSDRRFLSEQKEKLVYATRATCRYQKFSISSHFKM